MNKIFKYPLGIMERQTLQLPTGGQIIRAAVVNGLAFIWVLVDPEQKDQENRTFEMYKTGQPINKVSDVEYIGFLPLVIGEELGIYLFERVLPY